MIAILASSLGNIKLETEVIVLGRSYKNIFFTWFRTRNKQATH
jgi:hypothetical protein